MTDANFSEKCDEPAFVAELRKASVLIVHARKRNALTDAADIVLPTASLAGTEGTFVNAKGRVQRVDLMHYEKQRQETLKDLGADPYVD